MPFVNNYKKSFPKKWNHVTFKNHGPIINRLLLWRVKIWLCLSDPIIPMALFRRAEDLGPVAHQLSQHLTRGALQRIKYSRSLQAPGPAEKVFWAYSSRSRSRWTSSWSPEKRFSWAPACSPPTPVYPLEIKTSWTSSCSYKIRLSTILPAPPVLTAP
jgi:hypothetical protein